MSQIAAKFAVRNTREFFRELERRGQEIERAASTAVKVEGFRLMQQLRKEIREGAPGGKRFAPLSVVAAYSRRPYNRTAYQRLATAVRYDQVGKGADMTFKVGFISRKSSKAWVKIAERAQGGASFEITSARRIALARHGAKLAEVSVASGDQKYFFLRKSTTKANTPARQIITPFWRAHEMAARENIVVNFHRKLRGERIG